MRTARVLCGTALAAAVSAFAPSVAAAQPPEQPPGQQQGCNAAVVSAGAVDVSLLGTVSVHTDATKVEVELSGLVGTVVCGVIGGGAGPVPG